MRAHSRTGETHGAASRWRILVGVYHRYLGRAREPGEVVHGIIVVSWVFLVPYLAFALMYTGTI